MYRISRYPISKWWIKKVKKIVIRLTEKLCHRYNLITVTIIIYTFIIIYHANLSINVPFQTVELNTKWVLNLINFGSADKLSTANVVYFQIT